MGISELSALREENKNLREVRQQQQLLGNKLDSDGATQFLQTSTVAVSPAAGTPPLRCHAMAGLLQTRGLAATPASSPGQVWAPRSSIGSPSQTRPRSPIRQVSSPVRQRG